jgi:GNAT superfamily N-acetyltransferase
MIEVRTSTSAAEDARSNEIYNAVWPLDAYSSEDARTFKEAMREADDHLGFLDGTVAGSAFTAIRPDRPDVVFGLVTVLEQHRRRGIGSALYHAVSRWSAERGRDAIESFVDEGDAASVAFVEKRGFLTIERYERLTLDLAGITGPPVAPPDGLEVTLWDGTDDLARRMYEVALEAYPDAPGGDEDVVEPFDEWVAHELRRFEGTGGATFVALAGTEVVGWAQLTASAAAPGVGRHAFTAVKRGWRGKGVAGALKRTQIAWATHAGFEQLVTRNEERNAPMRRVNERLGYRPARARLFVRGPLSAGA